MRSSPFGDDVFDTVAWGAFDVDEMEGYWRYMEIRGMEKRGIIDFKRF